jgi:catechol 2,3-dioxygenase-like lactoylglutathione lyase family enzyme
MDLNLSHCFVSVHDIDLALAFYRDVLELDVHTDVTMDGFRWVTVSPTAQPDIEIGLMDPRMGPGAADADAVLALVTKGALNAVIFRTGDVDADFDKIRAAGAEVLQEPVDQPYGVRDCAFRDPSGNMIRLSQPAS